MYKNLKNKINNKRAKITVLGLGYVGLPLAVNFAKKGFKVTGLDKDVDRVNRLKKKKSYISDIPTRDVRQMIEKGYLKAATDFTILKEADVIIICVPTPIKRKYTPDVSYILSAIRSVRKFHKKGVLVILESTTYPGTTDELIVPELEKGGYKLGKDFYLSFSPERIDPGNKKYDVTSIPKVVGGCTEESGKLTECLYKKIIKKVHRVSSARSAEMSKLLENSFRIINIGWINEVARMCHHLGIDIWEVIDAAKTKPFGFMPFYPGLGVGGHCIPDDPIYLYWKAKLHGFSSKYIKLSADTNLHMPDYVVERIKKVLKAHKKNFKNVRILIVGATYKKDVKDLRKSPSLRLIQLLQAQKCSVDYFDPIIPFLNVVGIKMESIDMKKNALSRYDCVVIATDHTRIDYKYLLAHARCIFDVRNVYRGVKSKKIVKL